jgi:hypothetical protein
MLVVKVNSSLERFLPDRPNIYKSMAKDDEGRSYVVFLKFLLAEEDLLKEVVSGALGRKLHVSVLSPLLVQVPQHFVPEEFNPTKARVVCGFGTIFSQLPLVGRPLRPDRKPNPFFESMLRHEKTKTVAAFDELIDNNDRNHGNILYSGSDDPIFIDHGKSFSCIEKPTSPTSENWLFLYMRQWNEADRIETVDFLKGQFFRSVATLPLEFRLVEKALADNKVEASPEALIAFLEKRRPSLHNLIDSQLEIHQMELEDNGTTL